MTISPKTGILRTASFTAKRMRKCAICRSPFPPRNMTHKVCCGECGKALAETDRKARERKADKVRKEKNEPLEYWIKQAERAFNSWVLKRDAAEPCISCSRTDATAWNAGHYVSVGACRTIRFNEDNVHKQCARPCNKDLGGNAIKYRVGLVAKIGAARVEALEAWHAPVKFTIEQAQAIKAEYRQKLKELQA